jgi:branched-subunit amino acid transport protein AzlD
MTTENNNTIIIIIIIIIIIKAVIRHLPFTTPAEDISDGLVDFSFDVISVKCQPLIVHL